jgi:hypothetical protein
MRMNFQSDILVGVLVGLLAAPPCVAVELQKAVALEGGARQKFQKPAAVPAGAPALAVFRRYIGKEMASIEASMREDDFFAAELKGGKLRVTRFPVLRDLGADCDGHHLYQFSLDELETAPSSYGFYCGSGGCESRILGFKEGTTAFKVLYSDNASILGVSQNQQPTNCPPLVVEVSGIHFDRANREWGTSLLEFNTRSAEYRLKHGK